MFNPNDRSVGDLIKCHSSNPLYQTSDKPDGFHLYKTTAIETGTIAEIVRIDEYTMVLWFPTLKLFAYTNTGNSWNTTIYKRNV